MVYAKDGMSMEERPNMRGGSGTVKMVKLVKDLPKNTRLFNRIVLEKGVSIGEHTHEGETEMFYFISGHGRVLDDGVWRDVEPGDSMTTPSGHSHGVENTGDEPLVLAAVIVLD